MTFSYLINYIFLLFFVCQFTLAFASDKIILFENKNYNISINKDLILEITEFDTYSKSADIVYSGEVFKLTLNNDIGYTKFFITEVLRNKEQTKFGMSSVFSLKCKELSDELILNLKIIIPDSLENVLIISPLLLNISQKDFYISKIISCNLNINVYSLCQSDSCEVWSFQPESTPDREDWIRPLEKNYFRRNFLGMNASDYGGGIPFLDLWTKRRGIAIASLSLKPLPISFPINFNGEVIDFKIEDSNGFVLKAGEECFIHSCIIILHRGDFFNPLRVYSTILQKLDFNFPQTSLNSLEPEWCSWGYERNFKPDELLKTLDDVVDLGIKWVTIDDGWQSNYGDWSVSNEKFLNGDRDLIALIDSIHARGLKVRLWWVPLTANDSSYSVVHYPDRLDEFGMSIQSKIAIEHPEWFILDDKGRRYQVTWWNSYQLCPAVKEVVDYFKSLFIKAVIDWKVDGFKLDGQNLNLAPPCYNPEHNHKSPYESSEATPLFFNVIYETVKNLKSDFLIQLCPCGTNYSLYNLPFVDQVVASDPLGARQIRIKGKTFKALFGNKIAYSGDHVELTNRFWDYFQNNFIVYKEEDFLSTIGIGGIPSTKFTSPEVEQKDSTLMLTDLKKINYRKWLNLYNQIRLSEGDYLNLYDIACDKPETHVILKNEVLYYSLFADHFNGIFEVRGLKPDTKYLIKELITNKNVGIVDISNPYITLNFKEYLILEGRPIR